MAPKCKSTQSRNLLHAGAPLLLILHIFLSCSMMRRPNRTSLRTSLDEAFIRNAKSFCRTYPTRTYTLSFIVGVGSHCVTSRSLVHSCLSRSFTPICMDIVSNVLRVPRVEHPDYPGCDCLRTVSKDELKSSFYECPSDWGDCQFTSCTAFAKGPRFLNMVMTFVLYPLSHYNFITEPCAQFFLSFLKHLPIDFPSHFILSIIDVHRDLATRDKLIFLSDITRILRHSSIPFPLSNHFHFMGAIDAATVKRSEAQFRSR